MSSTPRLKASLLMGSSSCSVVMWVISARFFTSPHPSPSGVSEGHTIPHWEGWRERGPLTFLVFSNWLDKRVIIPRTEMKERRERTCVMPARSILKRLSDQLPLEMALASPLVIWSWRMCFTMSNCAVRVLGMVWSAILFSSELNFLNRSSKRRESNSPASSSRLLP